MRYAKPRTPSLAALLAGVIFLFAGCAATPTTTPSANASATPRHAVGSALASRLDSIAGRLDAQDAVVAVRVLDAETGEVLYTHGGIDTPLKPASNMKLLTASLALETFGPDHTFKTYLLFDGQDLTVVGTGDPGTGDPVFAGDGSIDEMFDDWAKVLRMRRITSVPGRLIIDDRAIDRFVVHPTWWPEDDLQTWYGAAVGGLNFNDNCIDFTAEPTAPGQPAAIGFVPVGAQITVHNNLVTAAAGDDGSARAEKSIGLDAYTFSGTLSEATNFSSKPVMDPGMLFAQAMRSTLERRGVAIAGDTVRVTAPLGEPFAAPTGDDVIAVHETPLADVIARILKPSQNMFADCTAKMIGLAFYQEQGLPLPGSWLGASRATRAWLDGLGIDHRGLVYADGSGLSHNNRVTARLISDLLLAMHRSDNAALWKQSLTIGGVDGTLRRRFTDTPGRVVGKTGTITGASSLSGYVTTDSGRELVFSILVNGNRSSAEARALQDDLVKALMDGLE